MDTFEIVIWEDELSDGALAYASWCTAVIGVSGQGETEQEALDDIASSMSVNIFEPWPANAPVFYEADVAAAEQVNLLAELDSECIRYRMHRLTMDDLHATYHKVHVLGIVPTSIVEPPAADPADEPAQAPAAAAVS